MRKDERQLIDPQRMLWRDDVDGICPTIDMCFEYGEHVRCGPCAIKQSIAHGVEPDLVTIPNLPEVSRLTRENKRLQGELTARPSVTDEMVEVRIGILGCDDSTYLTRQMTKEQFTFLEEVAEQISEQSTYGCMPVMNAALTAALGGPHG